MPIIGAEEIAVVVGGLLILVLVPAICACIDERRARAAIGIAAITVPEHPIDWGDLPPVVDPPPDQGPGSSGSF